MKDETRINKSVKKYIPIPIEIGGKTFYAHGPVTTTTLDIHGNLKRKTWWPKTHTETVKGKKKNAKRTK